MTKAGMKKGKDNDVSLPLLVMMRSASGSLHLLLEIPD